MGRTIAEKYELDGEIGRGGMGVVYSATHVLTGRRVAVKLLDPHPDPSISERLLKEARAAVRLRHKHVVDVLDVGSEPDGTTYLILELLRGESLEAHLKKRRVLEPEEAFGILLPIMNAVGAAHRAGFVHRDLKPANIFLHREDDGRVIPKLLDFGIAKEVGTSVGSGSLTKTGVILGTPHYMAPEQVESQTIGPATDVWSMGVVLYRCISGQHTFPGDNAMTVMVSISTGRFTPLHKAAPTIPFVLAEAIDRAISVDPAARYPTMDAFVDALFRTQQAAATGQGGGPASITPAVGFAATHVDEGPTVQGRSRSHVVIVEKSNQGPMVAMAAGGLGIIGLMAYFMYTGDQVIPAPVARVAPPPQPIVVIPTATVAVTATIAVATPTITVAQAVVVQKVEPIKLQPVVATPKKIEPVKKTEPKIDKRGAREAYERGLAAKGRGDPLGAIRALTEAVALAPDFVAAYNARGLLHQAQGKLHDAIADFTTAIELDPKNASLYNNRALARQARAESWNAIDDLTRAIDLDPGQALFYLHRGTAYSASGNRAKAIADFDRAIEKNSGMHEAYWGRAVAHQESGEHEKAIADLSIVLKRDARADAYYRRGRSLSELNRYAPAIEDFNQALSRDPQNANAYLRRGLAFVKLNKNQEAQKDLTRFLELDKTSKNRESVRRQLERLQKK